MNHKYWLILLLNEQIPWSDLHYEDSRIAEISAMLAEVKVFLLSLPRPIKITPTYPRMMNSLSKLKYEFTFTNSHLLRHDCKMQWNFENALAEHNNDFAYFFRLLFSIPQ
ncbi:MAG: hypothetical protein UW16_C0028G0014 [Microgenomates group bacterium GW2011_GWC1_44_10]|nr:MAG: hypothetical protein UW16_C0028G0014 [Microgenomates group bacterium GW2011_GWC1_44_10]